MKKIGLISSILLVGLGLASCTNSTKQHSHKESSNSSTVKVAKKHNKQIKKVFTSSFSASNSQQSIRTSSIRNTDQSNTQTAQQTQTSNSGHDTNPASDKNYNPSELHKNAQAAVGSDGLIHGRIYGSNGYWIDADASRQGLADAGMPNSDQDIINHAETGNAMWNAGQNSAN